MTESPPTNPDTPFDPSTIKRPDHALLTYYIIVSALTIVGFPFIIIPLLIRYHTLRYTFDDRGISMSWGIFFRKEIYLTYRRIQDIHVTRNILERWMGLAKVAVQTASGSSSAEMTIEGIKNPEKLRDHLYSQMRGARDETHHDEPAAPTNPSPTHDDTDDVAAILTDIRDELRRIRAARETNQQ